MVTPFSAGESQETRPENRAQPLQVEGVPNLFRVAVEDWSPEEAIREMTTGGYGFHKVWQNLPAWISELEMDSVKRDAGIDVPVRAEKP